MKDKKVGMVGVGLTQFQRRAKETAKEPAKKEAAKGDK